MDTRRAEVILLVLAVLWSTQAAISAESSKKEQPSIPYPICRSKLSWQEDVAAADLRIKKNPKDAEAFCKRGNAYRHLELFELALNDLNQAVFLEPNYAQAFYILGNFYLDQHDAADAISAYTRSIELDPDAVSAHHNRSLCHKALGNLKQAQHDMEMSERILQRLRLEGKEPYPPK